MKARPTELELIAKIRQVANAASAAPGSQKQDMGHPHPRLSPVRLGIGDDCAILRVGGGEEVLVTTDLSLEGRHFRRDWHPARSVGHRTLARGLSDLAAMGAKPLAAFLSIALPGEVAETSWLAEFMDGFLALATVSGAILAGGDTTEFTGGVVADIVLTGTASAGTALRRSGARVGDGIYVTGALGGSAAELKTLGEADTTLKHSALRGRPGKTVTTSASNPGLRSETRGTQIYANLEQHPHLFPQPRLVVGAALRKRKLATACIDVSDGISTDLAHLCSESRCGALIEAAALPVHVLAAGRADAMEMVLHGGEDYELLFTARAATRVPRSIAGVKITRIGSVTRGGEVKMVGLDGKTKRLEAKGWEHFR